MAANISQLLRHNFPSAPSCCAFSQSNIITTITFPYKPRRCTTTNPTPTPTPANLIRCTGGDAAETTATATETESETESPVEVTKGSPSLISTLNVERALRGIPIIDVDYYGALGIRRGCSYDQVYGAYKKKVEELMNEGLEEEEVGNKLELLKESYTILSNPKERRLYDWSLGRSEKPDTYIWPFEVDTSKKSTEPPPPQEPEDVGPTILVGYFMLGWLVLAFTLSIALNR